MEDFWKAIIAWTTAQMELQKEMDAYDGYSADYFFAHDVEAVQKLKVEAETALNAYIDERIEAKLSQRFSNYDTCTAMDFKHLKGRS
jgi:hypothetical protein